MSGVRLGAAAVCLTASATVAVPVFAQNSSPASAEQDNSELASTEAVSAVEPSGGSEIVVTGSRFGGRTRIESATPVDAISQ